MKKGLLLLAAIVLLGGCGKEKTTDVLNDAKDTEVTQGAEVVVEDKSTDAVPSEAEEGYSFEVNGVTVPVNVDFAPVYEKLGKEAQYFEAASCAFQGLDKMYTYDGFEISTYPNGNQDYISTVYFLDDSVTTKEGIYLGSDLSDVIAAYGESFTEESGEYTYTLGQTKLAFIIEDDSVASITYKAIVEGLNE